MDKKGRIIIISGPSGVGKKTIIDQVINDKNLNLVYSISMTTRQPRPGEKNGVDYFFVSDEEFKKSIENNELLEWAEFANNKYGTPLFNLRNKTKEGKNVILEIEVQGASNVKRILKRDEFISIFIIPPSIKELKKRLQKRNTENRKKIRARIKRAKKEIKLMNEYDYIVLNDNHVDAANKLREILNREIKDKKC